MATYLIFFGKSKSFTFKAFDDQSMFENFDSIIPNFSLLESQLFSVDNTDNQPILAKSSFRSVKEYSLLKLYSYAQASDSNRVAGSIYGVAFLSESDLSLCPENIELLFKIKNFFAELCLSRNKFKDSDFSKESIAIWKQFCDMGGFLKIKLNEKE